MYSDPLTEIPVGTPVNLRDADPLKSNIYWLVAVPIREL